MANPLDKFYFEQLYGDERRYRQFIINFLSNAIKFSKTNGSVYVLLTVNEIQDVAETFLEKKVEKSSSSDFGDAPDKEILSENEESDN